jgi:hypothetical protein
MPLKVSSSSFRRLPRPARTASMNCWWISSSSARVRAFSSGCSGEKGSSMPLCAPAVSRRRSTPSLAISSVKPKSSISTPIEPTIEARLT